MSASNGSGAAGAIYPALGTGSETPITLASESIDDEWFYAAAQSLLGKDAGLHLHYITGYPQSSCYAYVARDVDSRRRPPGHFLRTLFWSDQGAPFFEAFMHGCKAQWWLDLQRARRIAEAVKQVD